MMKQIFAVLALLASASAFTPVSSAVFGVARQVTPIYSRQVQQQLFFKKNYEDAASAKALDKEVESNLETDLDDRLRKLEYHGTALITQTTSPAVIDESRQVDVCLALAGGSLRAASSCYGVLRGFQQKRVSSPSTGEDVSAMDLVKYNSGISGGSIPSILYSYAKVTTEELLELDSTTDPSKITAESLSMIPETSMGYVIARKPDVKRILFRSILKVLSKPTNIFKMHSLWSGGVYKKVCEPLKMPKNKFFTSSKEELEKILKDNPQFKESDFLLPREDVKTLPMILITMHGFRADKNEYEESYRKIYNAAWNGYKAQETLGFFTNSFEKRPNMTELVLSARDKYGANLPMPYVITPDWVENKYSGTVQVRKNAEVEFPEKIVKPFEWGVKNGKYGRKSRFSVEFLVSISTNFVGSAGENSKVSLFVTGMRTLRLSDNSVVTQRFADGGTSDLMGIIPLVDRGTKNIISVYNFNQNPDFTGFTNSYADIYNVAPCTSMEDPDFDIHFQTWLKHINPRITCYFGFFNTYPINHANIMNHIFHDPNIDRLKELMIKYNSLFEAGEPLIATLKGLEVIDNPFWGISGGKTVDLTLIYFNMPRKFSENVPEEAVPPPEGKEKLDKDGRFTNEEFKVVPELPVDGANQLKYSPGQVNMMGYLGSWMVNHSWDGLKGLNGEVFFEGFGEIFEKKY